MPKPFRGTIDIDIRDSVPDWAPYEQPKAPEGAPTFCTSSGMMLALAPLTSTAG